jgi:hypothetical protein
METIKAAKVSIGKETSPSHHDYTTSGSALHGFDNVSIRGMQRSQGEGVLHRHSNKGKRSMEENSQRMFPGPNSPGPKALGFWRLVRLTETRCCDACTGTAKQETVNGSMEVFRCSEILKPGDLHGVLLNFYG